MRKLSTELPNTNREALAILRAAHANTETTEAYFKSCGIDAPPAAVMMLTPHQVEKFGLLHSDAPAIIAPIIGRDGLQGAHITHLTANGSKAAETQTREFVGKLRGGYVRIDNGKTGKSDRLIFAKTIEAATLASRTTGLSAVATLSTRNLATVAPPECREAIIVADNDRATIRAAEDLAHRLLPLGIDVRIAIADDDGGGWETALATAGANKQQHLRHELLNAPYFEPDEQVRGLPASDFVNVPFPPQEPLLGPWLKTRNFIMIHAARGAGKTWFGLSVAYALATGTPMLDWDAPRPVKVLYVDGELPGALLQERLRKFPGGDAGVPNLHILSPDLLEALNQRMPDLGDPEGRAQYDAIIERENPEVIILDSLVTLCRSGAGNTVKSWLPIQEWALRHRGQGRTIIFHHHEGRNGLPRGISNREDALDAMIGLTPQPKQSENGATVVELKFTKPRGFFGADAAPRLLSFTTASGMIEWENLSRPPSRFDEIQSLKADGMTQAEIAKKLNLTAGRISQIIKNGPPD